MANAHAIDKDNSNQITWQTTEREKKNEGNKQNCMQLTVSIDSIISINTLLTIPFVIGFYLDFHSIIVIFVAYIII